MIRRLREQDSQMFHLLITGILRIPSRPYNPKLIRINAFAWFCPSVSDILFITFVEMVRFELMTPCVQGRCSPN